MDKKTFISLLREAIDTKKELEKDTKYVKNDDLTIIYRLLGELGLWTWLNNNRK